MAWAAAFAAACSDPRERLLPAALELTLSSDDALTARGAVLPRAGGACDAEGAGGAATLTALLDTASPLSAYRPRRTGTTRALDDRVLLRSRAGMDGREPVRGLFCDAPMIALGSEHPAWSVGVSAPKAVELVVGGDVLRRYALQLTFGREPRDPTCAAPPCLRVGPSDISNNCQLAARGEAVLPFTLRGGDLLVQLGSEVLAVPPTRAVVDACIEPLADPGRTNPATECVQTATLEQRLTAAQLEITRIEGEEAKLAAGAQRCALWERRSQVLAQQAALEDLRVKISQGDARCQPGQLPLPAPPPSAALAALQQRIQAECPGGRAAEQPGALAVADLIESESAPLRSAPFLPSGTDARLLISTAVPMLVLSASLYARVTSDATLKVLMAGPAQTLHLPGPGRVSGWTVGLGALDGSNQWLAKASLALLSRERHLSPCLELARSRRQRYGLSKVPAGAAAPAAAACAKAACLQDLLRDPAQEQRRCAFSGQSRELACSDRTAPVAAVVELPVLTALVVPDTAAVLQEVNGDLRSAGTPQVDGILGVSVLKQLAAEVDLAGGRLIAHCACEKRGEEAGPKGCRTFPRATYDQADDCARSSQLQVSAAPVPAVQCRP